MLMRPFNYGGVWLRLRHGLIGYNQTEKLKT